MGGRVGGVGRDHSLCSIIMQLRWLQQWVVTGIVLGVALYLAVRK